jgi:hypothetical protein
MASRGAVAACFVTSTWLACARPAPTPPTPRSSEARALPSGMDGRTLVNRYAYIPPQCYTATRDEPGGRVHNPCFVCHQRGLAPNFVDDEQFQLSFAFPGTATRNPWTNLFDPPVARAARRPDAEMLAYVRAGNYFGPRGEIALASRLAALPAAWDGQGDGRWDGYVPDAWFRFDDRGFDRAADGTATGWRAFAYTPFRGTFFPTNGSMDDVLIRLDPAFRQDAAGRPSPAVYEVNLAVVEALVKRRDIAIDPVDERALGVDVDLDGALGTARAVAFRSPSSGAPAMRFVGRAGAAQARGELAAEPGLFPLGTELLHSVRYLDVVDGAVAMAARMKELRYAKKVRWLSPADLASHAAAEVTEQAESPDGVVTFLWQFDRGIYNGQGWLFQGFIEAADGALRPQSYEESVACVGCHGELGATTDSIFSLPRKLGADAPARGWFHWTQHGMAGLPEPRGPGGELEYTAYLEANGAGDELRENPEVLARFFDERGALRARAARRLHTDISTLLLPSPARALELDRAYAAIVREQSFARGRDAVLAPSRHVHARVEAGEQTGVARPVRLTLDVTPPAREASPATVTR